jgi:CheY-like chemotaxis protein
MIPSSDPPQHAIVVLVAEDDMLIRMFAVEALTEAGFTVLEVGHADDALKLLTAEARSVRALFTDINMPGTMSGLELAHHVRGNWPWIALLVTSGKAQPTSEELPTGSRFLSKPYQANHVVQHVRELVTAE